jgi:hypothetical protein
MPLYRGFTNDRIIFRHDPNFERLADYVHLLARGA